MTDPVSPESSQQTTAENEVVSAPAPQAASGAASEAAMSTDTDAVSPASRTAASAAPTSRRESSGRASGSSSGQQTRRGGKPEAPSANAATRRASRPVPPALEQLAELYPALFGAVFRPLKRGIFQELMAAHPELFEKDALKQALAIHTRSTRYLQAVASGQQRHDLQGEPVEVMAPEHIHHALVEVYKRRQGRGQDDLLPRLRARIVDNIESSGLTREEYSERVQNRDEAASAVLQEAMAELAERSAREEALLRTFEDGGQTVEAFADMYGMDPQAVTRTLSRARERLAASAERAAPDTLPVD